MAARMFRATALEYQPTFFTGLLLGLLPRLIVIDVFWLLLPYFQPFALFHVGYTWYGWLYALLMWDFSMWIWHYSAHKVRLLWCLHSPHHAPENLNMTVAWVHFFGEGYYSALVQAPLLMLLGVEPGMLVVIMAFEVTWGTFIHAGERSFRTGRFGPRDSSSSRPHTIGFITAAIRSTWIPTTARCCRSGTGCSAPCSPCGMK